jgi:aerobic carbon-monoxide dehydrogenase medium subunit
VIPAEFDYVAPSSLDEALTALRDGGEDAKVLAGGHSLLPLMKLRLAAPELLVDINELTDLAGISVADGELRIGAMTRHAELLASPLVGRTAPVLHDAERVIADAIVRNRGTIGGSVCQADPSEDLSGAFCALRASAVIRGEQGTRTVPMREFFLGPYQTAVGPAEILVELRVPLWAAGSAYVKVDRRAGDWAVAAAAAVVQTSAAGVITAAGLGLTAVGSFVATQAEEYLLGQPATEETFAEAGRLAAIHCRPAADQRGPVDYKRHLACELTVRSLRRATERAAA